MGSVELSRRDKRLIYSGCLDCFSMDTFRRVTIDTAVAVKSATGADSTRASFQLVVTITVTDV